MPELMHMIMHYLPLMEQAAGAGEYGGRGSSKPGESPLFTKILSRAFGFK